MRPTLKVEIALTTMPSETPVWTDVTAYVRAPMTITRGRQRELDTIQCGTATLVLDNRDRRFDPFNADGPYYGNLLPMRRVRIGATIPSTELPDDQLVFGASGDMGNRYWYLYSGFVETWNLENYIDGAQDGIVTVQLVDGFEPLSRAMLTGDFVQALSGVRIGAVLDAANWTVGASWVVGSASNGRVGTMAVGPVGDRALADGISEVQAVSLAGTTALQHIQDVASAEGGLFFVSKTGVATFYDRHRLLKEPFREPVAELGDAGAAGEHAYSHLSYSYGCEWIYNDVVMQAEGGDEQTASDATSQARYLRRTLSQTGLLLVSDTEVATRARFMLNRYRDPLVRFDSLELSGAIEAATWEALLAMDMGDLLTVRHQPSGGGDPWEQDSVIQGIKHEISVEDWRVTMWLAPHHAGDFWLVGVAEVGGADMRPAW